MTRTACAAWLILTAASTISALAQDPVAGFAPCAIHPPSDIYDLNMMWGPVSLDERFQIGPATELKSDYDKAVFISSYTAAAFTQPGTLMTSLCTHLGSNSLLRKGMRSVTSPDVVWIWKEVSFDTSSNMDETVLDEVLTDARGNILSGSGTLTRDEKPVRVIKAFTAGYDGDAVAYLLDFSKKHTDVITYMSQKQAASEQHPDQQVVYHVGGDVTPPKLIYSVDPVYSEEGQANAISGISLLQITVDANGNPQSVHTIRALGYGLDEQAIKAVNHYRFKPATKNGTPVAVTVNIQCNFHTDAQPRPRGTTYGPLH